MKKLNEFGEEIEVYETIESGKRYDSKGNLVEDEEGEYFIEIGEDGVARKIYVRKDDPRYD